MDSSSSEKFRSLIYCYFRNKNFIILVFSLYSPDDIIDEDYFKILKNEYLQQNSIVYLVGNKMDFLQKSNDLQNFVDNKRKKVKFFIEKYKITRYFEVDTKTGEGMEVLNRNIEFEIEKISLSMSKKIMINVK